MGEVLTLEEASFYRDRLLGALADSPELLEAVDVLYRASETLWAQLAEAHQYEERASMRITELLEQTEAIWEELADAEEAVWRLAEVLQRWQEIVPLGPWPEPDRAGLWGLTNKALALPATQRVVRWKNYGTAAILRKNEAG